MGVLVSLMIGFFEYQLTLQMQYVNDSGMTVLCVHLVYAIICLDNLDHNPSSTTASDSFHGTGISLFYSSTPISIIKVRIGEQ